MRTISMRQIAGLFAVTVSFAAFAQDQDVIRIEGGGSLERHSNIFKLPSGVDPTSIYGKSTRSDTIVRGNVGITFDREVSLQRFRADARIEPTKYVSYSKFDYLGYSGGLNWDWAIGQAIYGTLGVRVGQTLSSFLNTFTTGDKNLERRQSYYGSAGLRLTPSWSAFVGIDQTRLDNSVALFQSSNYTYTSGEGGMRFAPGTGTEISLVARHTNGDYSNLQLFDVLGNVLAQGIDNSFKQNALLARMQIKPSDDSRIAGEIGYTKRDYNSVPQRDFSGVTAAMNLEWKPTGAFFMKVDLVRDLTSPNFLTANYVDLTELRLYPTVVLTGKMTLNGRLTYGQASYKGDPGFVASAGPVRKDNLTTVGAQLAYEFSRNLTFTADIRQERRSSNYNNFEFTDNIVGVGVLAKF